MTHGMDFIGLSCVRRHITLIGHSKQVTWAGSYCFVHPPSTIKFWPAFCIQETMATGIFNAAVQNGSQESLGHNSVLPLHMNNSRSAPQMKVDAMETSHSGREQVRGDMLPTWTANPQSPGDEAVVASPVNRHLPGHSEPQRTSPLLAVTLVVVGIVAIITSRTAIYSAASMVLKLQSSGGHIRDNIKSAEQGVRKLQREFSAVDAMLHRQQDLQSSFKGQVSQQRAMNELNALQSRVKDMNHQVDVLKSAVQTSSKEEIVQKYGRGLHRVEIELVFPDHQIGPSTFVIELAPVDTVPHSILTFLEMVSNGLLDGCSFILNALHVLKAAPLPYDGKSAERKAREFAEHGLESVSFKEYSEAYPHKQYTVGFAADGSPSFYINTEDNTEIHVGDPCFGRVVEGFDAVRRLESSPTRNGIWFERRIGIKRARIVRN